MTLFRFSPAALACVLLLAACQSQDQDSEANDDEESPPIPVEISLPTRGDVFAVYSGTAPVEAFAEADVIAKVDGEIRNILVEEGDEIKKGQVLARLDGDRLRLELNESEARLRKLQRDYERNLDLKGTGLISEGEFEKIKFEMAALQASFNLAKLELDYTQIRAPIEGVIAERYIKLGNTVNVGAPVFRVTSLEPLVAYLHVPEREYRNIDSGQLVQIEIDALQGEPIIASVSRVSPIVDPATGTFKVSVEITDEERRIKPGMFGRISIVYDKHENALQLPRSALIEDSGQTSVFVVEDNVAIKKIVQTGYSDRGMVEIVAGLEDGENVVTVGQLGLKPDAKVTVINLPQSTVAAADETKKDAAQPVTDNATTD